MGKFGCNFMEIIGNGNNQICMWSAKSKAHMHHRHLFMGRIYVIALKPSS